MPSILSGDTIGFLDPLEQYFSFDPHERIRHKGKRGQKWTISSQLLNDYPDQFSPYLDDLFQCNATNFQNGRFPGTIFRFPLRKKPSFLSKSLFDDENRMHELFKSFETDAEITLLFLKHVESIAVYEKGQSDERARLVFKIEIPFEDRHEVHSNMATFLSKIPDHPDFQTLSCFRVKKQIEPETDFSISRYITMNALNAENISKELKDLINDVDLKLLPWMGISFRASSTIDCNVPDGRTFCFLPLPESEQTGLPVHVHGYFGLGDNRRSIKWPDQESQHDKKALWNKLLVTEVFPKVYLKLILAVIDKSKQPTDPMTSEDVYKAWPCIKSMKKEWEDGVKTFLQLLGNEAIFYTDHNGGCWMRSADVYVDTLNNPLLAKVLRHKRCPVAQLPNHVTESLHWADVHYQEITPTIVRSCIRGDTLQFLTRDEKLEVLKYVTSDTVSDLANLYLLPLQNGTFTSFCKTSTTVYIATSDNPSVLIPNGDTTFAASDMPAVLNNPQVLSNTQLKILQADDVAPLLREMLPSTWIRGTDVKLQVPWTLGDYQHPSIEWLTEMWNWLTKNHTDVSLMSFEGIPLIHMETSNYITKLEKNSMIFHKQQISHDLPIACLTDNICLFLETVGAVVIRHDLLSSKIISHPHLDRFIKAPTAEGIMAILEAFRGTVNLNTFVENASTDVKDELRSLLAQLRQFTPGQKEILQELPIFQENHGKYISANYCVDAVPSNFFEIPVTCLRGNRLILRDSSDNLACMLGVHRELVGELLSKNILPAVAERFYNTSESVEIMNWVLKRPEYDALVHKLKLIPISDQEMSSPIELFEPNDRLCMMFRNKKVFPTDVYSKGKLLDFLKRVV